MRLSDCHNLDDFRTLARRRLPGPVFHYIDGAADDEITRKRNREAYNACDLVPNVLAGVENIDMSVTVLGRKLDLPFFLSPTALQRMFHRDGEAAVGAVAQENGTYFGISSLATISIEDIARTVTAPKMFQLYVHKDKGLNSALIERCKAARFDALTLTVDTIVGGRRERDLRTGFTSPVRLTLPSMLSYAFKPGWAFNYFLRTKFELANLKDHYSEGSKEPISIGNYFDTVLDRSMDWKTAEKIRADWGGEFCLKGVMSADDARRAADIGCDGVIVSNHGGRQLDGAVASLDVLADIVDAVGERLVVMFDSGIRRGTDAMKALALGAKFVFAGRATLFGTAAAGEAGAHHALEILRTELHRDLGLAGCRSIADLNRSLLRRR